MYKYPTGKIYRFFLFLACFLISSLPRNIKAQETLSQTGLYKTASSGISLNAQYHDFGSGTSIGDTALWSLEIISSGADTLDIDSLIIINSMNLSSSVFSVTTYDTMLASGDTLRDTVLYIPQESRRYIDSLKIYSNASGSTVVPVALMANSAQNYIPIIKTFPDTTSLDTVDVYEDTQFSYQLRAEDFDLDVIQPLTIVNKPSMLIPTAGGYINYEMKWVLNWTPDQRHVGVHEIKIIVKDVNAAADTQIFYINVIDVNAAPSISAIPDMTIYVDSLFTYQVNASDDEGDPISYSLNVTPISSYGEMTISSGGLIQWRPDNTFNGDEINTAVRVDDGRSGVVYEEFTIMVAVLNYPPERAAAIADVSVYEDGDIFTLADLDTVFSDLNGITTLNYIAEYDSNALEVAISAGNVVSFIPKPDYFGTTDIIFSAADGEYTTYDTVDVTVYSVDDAPVIVSELDTTINENAVLEYRVSVINVDSDSIYYELLTAPGGMTIDASGLIHWIPDDANVGDTVIVVRVYDDSSSADTSVFSITVTGINDAPVFSGIPDITVSEDFSDSSILLTDYVNDDDNSDSEISFAVSGYDTLSVSIQAGRIYIIPPENWNGVDSFVVSGSDPAGASGYDTVAVTVRPINDAPVMALISDKVVTEDSIFTYQIEVTDVDGDSFRYELLTAPDGMVVSSSGLITWNPGNDDVGDAAVAAAVYDDSSAADTVMFSITVVDENDAPVLAGIPDLVIVEDMPDSSIDLSDYVTDVDNAIDEITFSVTGDDYLSITIAGGKVHIVPQENWSGQDTIIFGAQDPAGEFSYDTLVVSVISANDAPRIVSVPDTSVYEDSEYVYQVEA